MTITSTTNDSVNNLSTCSESRIDSVVDSRMGEQELARARSQPALETKIFPARKRQCGTTIHPNNNQPDIQVIKSTIYRYNPDEDYKISSNPRGICLIINNVNFETESLPERKGSDVDAIRFKKIFSQLGFNVIAKRNMPAMEMKTEFTLTSAACRRGHDALVVILMSHGNESAVYGSDGCEINIYDMLTHFDNVNCRQLMGKPKMFFVQACRGRKTDYGIREHLNFQSQPNSQGYTQPSQMSQQPDRGSQRISRWSEIDRDNHATRTDMLLCFSCHLGFGSIRNEDEGSWLGNSLTRHLQESAHNRHLLEILNMVSRDIRLRKSTDGHKQVLEVTTIGFDRNLYFNPGQYDDKTRLASCK